MKSHRELEFYILRSRVLFTSGSCTSDCNNCSFSVYVLICFQRDNKRKSQVKLGSAADFSLDINETDLSLLTASIKAPSGRDEPCLLKRQPNNHIGRAE